MAWLLHEWSNCLLVSNRHLSAYSPPPLTADIICEQPLTLLAFFYFRHFTNTGLWMTWMQNRHITNTLLYVQMITWFRNIWLQPLAQTFEKLLFLFVSSSCKIAPDDGMCISFLKILCSIFIVYSIIWKICCRYILSKDDSCCITFVKSFFGTSLIKLYSTLNDMKYWFRFI